METPGEVRPRAAALRPRPPCLASAFDLRLYPPFARSCGDASRSFPRWSRLSLRPGLRPRWLNAGLSRLYVISTEV